MTRAIVDARLQAIATSQPADVEGDALKQRILAFERSLELVRPEPILAIPPGAPIGEDDHF